SQRYTFHNPFSGMSAAGCFCPAYPKSSILPQKERLKKHFLTTFYLRKQLGVEGGGGADTRYLKALHNPFRRLFV
ncbi:MAG: hypothetical protein V3V45_00110, partial [Candidatus Brocadiales bacterium]